MLDILLHKYYSTKKTLVKTDKNHYSDYIDHNNWDHIPSTITVKQYTNPNQFPSI